MRDLLHDETDAVEDLRERAQKALDVVREKLPEIATYVTEQGGDFRDVFALASELYEEQLTDLTTEAAQVGVMFGLKKAQKGMNRA